MPDAMKYPQNAIDGFTNGCLLDLRVRLAVDLLKSPMFENATGEPAVIAAAALDLTTALMAEAESRGLVAPLPEGPELNSFVRNQAKRIGAFQFEQQMAMNELARAAQGNVVSPFGPRAAN